MDLVGKAYIVFRSLKTRQSSVLAMFCILKKNFVPIPASETTFIDPPSEEIFFLTTSNPTPLPEVSLTSLFVENPG